MDLTLSEEVVAMLVCPETGQRLHVADAAELAQWQADPPCDGALVNEDGSRAYPVRDGFPVIVIAEALRRR